jgi:hypothetical protein
MAEGNRKKKVATDSSSRFAVPFNRSTCILSFSSLAKRARGREAVE